MKMKLRNLLLTGMAILSLSGCGKNNGEEKTSNSEGKDPASYSEALKTSKGKTVTFYGFGGSETANQWLDDVVAPMLKEEADITLKRVPMNIEDILAKLTTEKEASKGEGDIDIVWINGENFYTAKQADLLYGPITDKVENVSKLMDADSDAMTFDFGVPTEGYEVPYGTAQLVFVGNKTAFNGNFPKSAEELLAFAKNNPGKLTYTAPPEFTGSAFVRNILCDVVGFDALNDAKADYDELYQVAKPGFDLLNQLKPYLWEKGTTYPATTAELDKMFADNQIAMTYSYSQMYVASQRELKVFNDDAMAFVFDKGTIANTSYLAIPKTSKNKDAALVAINTIISEKAMQEKAKLSYGASIPPYSVDKMSEDFKEKLNQLYSQQGALSIQELTEKQIPELAAEKVGIIEQLWKDKVLNE